MTYWRGKKKHRAHTHRDIQAKYSIESIFNVQEITEYRCADETIHILSTEEGIAITRTVSVLLYYKHTNTHGYNRVEDVPVDVIQILLTTLAYWLCHLHENSLNSMNAISDKYSKVIKTKEKNKKERNKKHASCLQCERQYHRSHCIVLVKNFSICLRHTHTHIHKLANNVAYLRKQQQFAIIFVFSSGCRLPLNMSKYQIHFKRLKQNSNRRRIQGKYKKIMGGRGWGGL